MAIQRAANDYRLIATSNGATTPVPSDPFTVTGAAARSLTFSTPPPATVTAGAAFTVRLQAVDSFDNPTNYTGTVNLFAPNESVNAVGTATFTNATESAISTSIILRRAGANTLIIDPGVANLLAPGFNEQRNLTVDPAGIDQLIFLTQPPLGGLRNTAFTVKVRSLDEFDNLVINANQVQLDLRQNNATVNNRLTGGVALLQNTVNGEAEFSVSVDTVGNGYTLRASVPAAAIGSFDSSAFTINPRYRMRFTTQPSYCCAYTGSFYWYSVGIEVLDQNGNIDSQPIELRVEILNEDESDSSLTAIVWPNLGTNFTINGTTFTYVAIERTTPNANRRLRFSAVDTSLGIDPLISNAFLP
jgi:hypothetical protein